MKKILKYLNEELKKEKNILLFNFIIFILGLTIGTLFINFITSADKTLLIEQLETYLSNINKLSNDVYGLNLFIDNIINNGLQLFIIFALGISMIGVLAVILILFFKGFMLGATLSTFLLKYKLKGVLGALLYVFPCYVLNIFIYIFLCYFAVKSCVKFLKAFFKKDKLDFRTFLGKYLLSFFISLLLMLVICLLDAYITPYLLKLFTFLI